ncbi:hypothetical protein QBC33DRAFT_530205 [Phialemonium atrogriseum]|uniref:Uncharacterized protein n=1 Tax=Phialemonium atrogriseum TaxID=1093897 RepID=A0AAJ0C615_9PEZI|nr:uncharacterized protein QBC33DRAFT_530205 [Phialemonium atrogriseum]KAK1770132.1 hypothetical protein QBC33DRAFT_530205 [Phialemonium atrogriseum]
MCAMSQGSLPLQPPSSSWHPNRVCRVKTRLFQVPLSIAEQGNLRLGAIIRRGAFLSLFASDSHISCPLVLVRKMTATVLAEMHVPDGRLRFEFILDSRNPTCGTFLGPYVWLEIGDAGNKLSLCRFTELNVGFRGRRRDLWGDHPAQLFAKSDRSCTAPKPPTRRHLQEKTPKTHILPPPSFVIGRAMILPGRSMLGQWFGLLRRWKSTN